MGPVESTLMWSLAVVRGDKASTCDTTPQAVLGSVAHGALGTSRVRGKARAKGERHRWWVGGDPGVRRRRRDNEKCVKRRTGAHDADPKSPSLLERIL